MTNVQQVTGLITDHFERRWLVWVVGIVALLVGIIVGYGLPSGGFGFGLDASSNITGPGGVELRQGGW